MSDDDNDGQMIFGDFGGLKLLDICLTGEEKTRKNLIQETGDRTRARCVTGEHATACPTAGRCSSIDNDISNMVTQKIIKFFT